MTEVLKSLLIFTFILALAGTALAGGLYFTVEKPSQKEFQVPQNDESPYSQCVIDYKVCSKPCREKSCQDLCSYQFTKCKEKQS